MKWEHCHDPQIWLSKKTTNAYIRFVRKQIENSVNDLESSKQWQLVLKKALAFRRYGRHYGNRGKLK